MNILITSCPCAYYSVVAVGSVGSGGHFNPRSHLCSLSCFSVGSVCDMKGILLLTPVTHHCLDVYVDTLSVRCCEYSDPSPVCVHCHIFICRHSIGGIFDGILTLAPVTHCLDLSEVTVSEML